MSGVSSFDTRLWIATMDDSRESDYFRRESMVLSDAFNRFKLTLSFICLSFLSNYSFCMSKLKLVLANSTIFSSVSSGGKTPLSTSPSMLSR